MEFSFHTEEIRDACETRAKALEMLGMTAGVELHRRLADLAAAENVAEYFDIFPSMVVDVSANERAILFADGHSLVFRSGHVETPRMPGGATDWSRVSRMYFLAIERAV